MLSAKLDKNASGYLISVTQDDSVRQTARLYLHADLSKNLYIYGLGKSLNLRSVGETWTITSSYIRITSHNIRIT